MEQKSISDCHHSDDINSKKRFQSVRKLPQGQFNKYRQMFDALTKRSSKEKNKCDHSYSYNSTSIQQEKATTTSTINSNLKKKKINQSYLYY